MSLSTDVQLAVQASPLGVTITDVSSRRLVVTDTVISLINSIHETTKTDSVLDHYPLLDISHDFRCFTREF